MTWPCCGTARWAPSSTNRMRPCGQFGLSIAKSSAARHFRVLLEAGLIRQWDDGNIKRNGLRREEIEQRFPGLLDMVLRESANNSLADQRRRGTARPWLWLGLVEHDDQADNFAVAHAEVVRHENFLWQAGLVERAVVGQPNHGIAVLVEHFADVDGDLLADDVQGKPVVDGVAADELATVVVDVRVWREGGGGPVDVAGVDRVDVLGDDPFEGNVFRDVVSLLVYRWLRCAGVMTLRTLLNLCHTSIDA
jgi:hypothetical protein